MNFRKISEDELKVYNNRDNERPALLDHELLQNIRKQCKLILKKIETLIELEKVKDFEKLSKESINVVKISERMTQLIRVIPLNYGQSNAYEIIKDGIAADHRLVFKELEGNTLQIILPGLLPRRQQNGKIFENLDYIRTTYAEGFERFFNEKKYAYSERVVILYKNYFLSDHDMIDDDNFDSKIITDFIAQYMLVDDNPKRCMKVYDYGISDYRHSEIFIFPLSQWQTYIEVPYF